MKEKRKRKIFKKFEEYDPPVFKQTKSFPERASDSLTKWVGSWTFIIIFALYVGLWIAANVYAWLNTWDLYPFILLNLTLSVLAAIQAPIILMSQNRQSKKDRIRTEYDYSVNRKAEREITDIKKQLNRIENRLLNKKR
jgi:CRP/FNR family transcriptional regulator, cyclic AMP receptor protein